MDYNALYKNKYPRDGRNLELGEGRFENRLLRFVRTYM